jgi:hypothetical protein
VDRIRIRIVSLHRAPSRVGLSSLRLLKEAKSILRQHCNQGPGDIFVELSLVAQYNQSQPQSVEDKVPSTLTVSSFSCRHKTRGRSMNVGMKS